MEFNPNIAQPDPEWDYYELWHKAHETKDQLEEAIKYMAAVEEANDSTDARLRERFYRLGFKCEECTDLVSEIDDEDDIFD